jgi:DNA polymerase
MFIGEAPGEVEELLGAPFVGSAGRILREALIDAGVCPGDVYITNVVKCRPPGNRQPTQTEIDACKPYIDEELRTVNPRKVITMGKTATSLFKEVYVMSSIVGKSFVVDGRTIIPVYHPAYALHSPTIRNEVIKLIQDAIKL